MEIDHDKLEKLFQKRHQELSLLIGDHVDRIRLDADSATKNNTEFWVDYCDKHKIIMMHSEWVREEFNHPRKNMICIHNVEEKYHEYVCDWLLVPKKFAEKCLILGGLP